MKQMYVCEKCGKMSSDYEEIAKCESMHYSLVRGWCGDDKLEESLENGTHYKEGEEEPDVIHVLFQRSYWNGDEWKEEKRCGKYRLVSSYDMPLVITDD